MAAGKKKGNPEPNLPPSRGVPADETMWLPRHDGADVRAKGGLGSKVRWELSDVVDFVFPVKYQPTYHEVASSFLKLVLEKGRVSKAEVSSFLKENDFSRSTLENKVIPKLARCGLIKREREASGSMKKKSRVLVVSESLTYSNYLRRIADEWETLVETSRHRQRKTE